MELKVLLHGFPEKARDVSLPDGATGFDLLRVIGISPELVLVFRNRVPMPLDDGFGQGDEVAVLRIVSGG